MGDTNGTSLNPSGNESRRAPAPEAAQRRAVGSPLPMGSGNGSALGAGLEDSLRSLTSPPPPGRSLNSGAANGGFDITAGVQKAMSALRAAMPFVQRMLPLLDGHIGSAVSSMLAPHHHTPSSPPPVPVNLAPLEEGLVRLETHQRELGDQLLEQNSSLKRVEDQLEMVREATDRNTLEQQELLEDLKVVGNKINLFAMVVLGLLVISMIINIFLYARIKSVFP
jgi:hypothetical protein